MKASWPIVGFGAALVVLAMFALVTLVERAHGQFVIVAGLHAALYIGAIFWVLSGRCRPWDIVVILIVAVALRAVAFPAPQSLTTDAFRYVWDGRIQLQGFNPYLWVPADERFAHLRDALIYPNIYLKDVAVTIYPPFAQILFAIGNWLSDSVTGVKIVMTAFDLAAIVAVWLWLRADGVAPERVLIYAWHPLPLWEFTGQAHLDAAAVALMLLAIVLVVRQRQFVGGGILALAACTKYFPVVLIPALWKRWDWRMPAGFIIAAVIVYAPYVHGAGGKVLGFLLPLAEKQGYTAGYGFHVIWLLRDYKIADPPGWAYMLVALGILAGVALVAFLVRQRSEVRPAYLVLLAAVFIWLTSPHYAWYFGWLVPLLARHLSVAALAMTLLALVRYLPVAPPLVTPSTTYMVIFGLPLLRQCGSCPGAESRLAAAPSYSASPLDQPAAIRCGSSHRSRGHPR